MHECVSRAYGTMPGASPAPVGEGKIRGHVISGSKVGGRNEVAMEVRKLPLSIYTPRRGGMVFAQEGRGREEDTLLGWGDVRCTRAQGCREKWNFMQVKMM